MRGPYEKPTRLKSVMRGNHTLNTEVCVKRVVQQSAMRGPYEKPTRLKSVMRGPDEQITAEEKNVEKGVDEASAEVKGSRSSAEGDFVKTEDIKKNETGDMTAVPTGVWGHNGATVHNRDKVWFHITDVRNKV